MARTHCLSLGWAVLAYAALTGICGAVELIEALQAVKFLGDHFSKASVLVRGRIYSVFIAAGFDFTLAVLSVIAVIFQLPRLTSTLVWGALLNGVYSFITVTTWYLGLRLSLWASIGLALPMIRVFASLANVQSVGGKGFEGKSYLELGQAKGGERLVIPGQIRRLGTWSGGMTVGAGVTAFSLICFVLSMLEVAGYWNDHLFTISSSGPTYCLLAHGILVGVAGLAGLLSIAGGWKPCTAVAHLATIVAVPASVTLVIWWNILWWMGRLGSQPSSFWDANSLVGNQYGFLLIAPLALRALGDLQTLQDKSLTGFEVADSAEGEDQSLVANEAI